MHTRFKVCVQNVQELKFTRYQPTRGLTAAEIAALPEPQPEKYGELISCTPVYEPNPEGGENRSFWEATPNGRFEAQIDNKAVWGKFVIGDEFYVDFTKAPKQPQ